MQRYLSVQTKQMAINALYINLVGLFILMITCAFGGMVVYAKYADCDPIRAGIVSKGDKLFPLFVMDTLGQFRGLPGLFVAGIFSGALRCVCVYVCVCVCVCVLFIWLLIVVVVVVVVVVEQSVIILLSSIRLLIFFYDDN